MAVLRALNVPSATMAIARRIVANLNTRNDQVRSEIATIERQLEALEAGGARGLSSVHELRSTLARIRAWGGLDAVRGRGVTVVIRGAIDGPAIVEYAGTTVAISSGQHASVDELLGISIRRAA